MIDVLARYSAREHGAPARPPVAGERLGDAQLRVAVAVAGVQADERVVHVFLQRHVAHHAHGAEAFRGVLGGVVDRLRREGLGDGRERQVGEAAVGDRLGMVGRPGRLPDRGARDLEPDRDLGELRADRLVLDDAAAALHAQLRVVERRLVGGAADAEIERLSLRRCRGRRRRERRFDLARRLSAGTRQSSNATVAAGAVEPASLGPSSRAPSRPGASRGTSNVLDAVAGRLDLHGEQLRERRIGDAVLDAVDDPVVARALGGGLEARVDRLPAGDN